MQSSTIGRGRLATCSAITSKGTPCRNAPTTGSSYCPAHAPERAEARRRSASIAGRSKPATEVHEVKRQLRKLANDVLSGAVNTSIAGCSEVEPSSHGLVNACAAFPSEAHAAHRYAWVNNSATCCSRREGSFSETHGIKLSPVSPAMRVYEGG